MQTASRRRKPLAKGRACIGKRRHDSLAEAWAEARRLAHAKPYTPPKIGYFCEFDRHTDPHYHVGGERGRHQQYRH